MKQLIVKIALFLGYAIFASWSAYMTATSIHLKWLSEMPFALAFTMIFIISLVAGWCLTLALKEIKNPVNPHKGKFIVSLFGFILFWGFSFATNVHYSYVTQHGYDNINRQVHSCVVYLTEKTDVADSEFNNMKTAKKEEVKAKVLRLQDLFHNSINDTRDGREGFGDDCISKLNAIEQVFLADTALYHDQFDYTIFNETYDAGDRGVNQYNRFSQLQYKYDERIQRCLEKKYEVMERYYNSQKANNDNLKNVLKYAKEIEAKSLPQIKSKKNFATYYSCYDKDVSKLMGQMPADYFQSITKYKTKKNGTKEVVGYTVYPSDRMFDFVNVWKDWFNGNLPNDQSLAGKMPLALIFDIIAFVLICLI